MSLFLLATSKPRQHPVLTRLHLMLAPQAAAGKPSRDSFHCRRILRLEVGGYACFGFAGDLDLFFSLLFKTTHSGLAMKIEE